eukprot:88720-Chlamydomonas_euryale.AAC.2
MQVWTPTPSGLRGTHPSRLADPATQRSPRAHPPAAAAASASSWRAARLPPATASTHTPPSVCVREGGVGLKIVGKGYGRVSGVRGCGVGLGYRWRGSLAWQGAPRRGKGLPGVVRAPRRGKGLDFKRGEAEGDEESRSPSDHPQIPVALRSRSHLNPAYRVQLPGCHNDSCATHAAPVRPPHTPLPPAAP